MTESTAGSVLDVLTLAQFSGDWWMEFVMIPSAREANLKAVMIWIGDQSDQFVVIQVSWQTGLTSPTQQQIIFGQPSSGVQTVLATVGDLAAEHAYALEYRAAEGKVHAWMDGVDVGATPLPDLGLVTDRRFDLYFSQMTVATQPRVTRVAVGIGPYAG